MPSSCETRQIETFEFWLEAISDCHGIKSLSPLDSDSFHEDKYVMPMRTPQLAELLRFACARGRVVSARLVSTRLVSRVPLRPDSLSEVIHRSLKNSQAAFRFETSSRCPTLPLAFHLLRATELSVKSFPRESRNSAETRRKWSGKKREVPRKGRDNLVPQFSPRSKKSDPDDVALKPIRLCDNIRTSTRHP